MLKKLVCGLVALSFGFLLLAADDAFVGTWKLNTAKSKQAKGREAKNGTVIVAVDGDTTSVTDNVTGIDGQTFSIKYTVPTAGGSLTYSQAPPGSAGTTDVMKKIDNRTYEMTSTMSGKEILRQHIVASPDHKTMTVRESGVDEKGQAFKSVYVYDRQ